ncbi:MAG: MBL fold metallo-hydrolase [Mogibacterium sp.]|nr:MBL fold metallo-hydrolase [Mogibacterium sp.]
MADIIQIDANTWRFEDSFVRFFLLTGTERALLIDTGATVPDARALAASLTDLPLLLINTHADGDHISGNNSFDEVMMHPDEEAMYRAYGGTNKVVPVKEGDMIDLGGRKVEIIENPGHTAGSIALLDVEKRVLYSGDAVQDGTIFLFNPYRNIHRYIEGLEHLTTFRDRFDVVYPCHGTIPVSPDLIPQLIAGAKEIVAGQAVPVDAEVFGQTVSLYRFPYAGFYCEKAE